MKKYKGVYSVKRLEILSIIVRYTGIFNEEIFITKELWS